MLGTSGLFGEQICLLLTCCDGGAVLVADPSAAFFEVFDALFQALARRDDVYRRAVYDFQQHCLHTRQSRHAVFEFIHWRSTNERRAAFPCCGAMSCFSAGLI